MELGELLQELAGDGGGLGSEGRCWALVAAHNALGTCGVGSPLGDALASACATAALPAPASVHDNG